MYRTLYKGKMYATWQPFIIMFQAI